jgi:hypothetical protein
MAKNKGNLNLLVLISNPGLNKVALLLFCHLEDNVNDLKYFYQVVVEIDCKDEYKIKTLKNCDFLQPILT